MTNTVNDVSGYEDIIFNFRAYPIQNEGDYLASLADFQLLKDLVNTLIDIKTAVLKEIVETNQHQMTEFAFEFLIQSLTKNNINLFTNIINYSAINQTTIL